MTNSYCDVDNSWSFDEYGDLNLTTDYGQSITNRVLCPIDFLNIYYEEYGSELSSCLGEAYDEESIRYYLEKALNQDSQIIEHEIINISLIDGEVVVDLTIDGVELNINLTNPEESVEESEPLDDY